MKLRRAVAVMAAVALMMTSGIVPQDVLALETYHISYDLGGGTATAENPTSYDNQSVTLIDSPTRTGYVFDGWEVESEGRANFTNNADVSVLGVGSSGDVKLYAQWEVVDYKIEYDYDGGSITGSNKETYTVEDPLDITNPEKSGAAFKGWQVDVVGKDGEVIVSNGTPSSTIVKGSHGNVKLTAQWAVGGHTINYFLDGGSFSSSENPSAYCTGDEVTIENPSKPGYTFTGWTDTGATDHAVMEYKIAADATGDLSLIAHYTADTYAITYDLNGGKFPNSVDVKNYYTVEEDFLLDRPSRVGYDFKGWTAGGDDDASVDYRVGKGSIGRIDVKAVWEPTKYNIDYRLEGGALPDVVVRSYTIEDSVALPTPVRNGYVFDGWEQSDGTLIRDFEAGRHEDITLTAKWIIVTYDVTYVANGGTLNGANPTKYTVETYAELKNPTRTGYDFVGWSSEGVEARELYEINKGTTGDLTITANWSIKDYPIAYDLQGGSFSDKVIESYTVEEAVSLPTPVRTGYVFKGWYDKAEREVISGFDAGRHEKVQLTAEWEKEVYSIKYDLDGGTLASPNPKKYTVEDEFVLGNPTKTGYEFAGWSVVTGGDGDGDVDESEIVKSTRYEVKKGSTGDLELKANWAVNAYHIEYVLNGGRIMERPVDTFTVHDTVTLPTPVRDGYEFVHWEDADGYVVAGFEAGRHTDLKVSAVWKILEYGLEYDLDGGSVEVPNPKEYTPEDEFVLNNPTKKGYTFIGWELLKEESEEEEEDPILMIMSVPKGSYGDKSYKAHYSVDHYKISYDEGEGHFDDLHEELITDYTVEDDVIFPQKLSKDSNDHYDYEFRGWVDQDGRLLHGIEKGTVGNFALVASYAAIAKAIPVYSLEYDLDGGRIPGGRVNPATYSSLSVLTLSNPVRDGYVFDSWSVLSESTGEESKDDWASAPTCSSIKIKKYTHGNFKYRANWKAIEYALDVDLNGGHFSDGRRFPTRYTIESDDIVFGVPEKKGYTFAHWEDQNGNVVSGGVMKGSIGDVSVTAAYRINEYDIVYRYEGGTMENDVTNPQVYTVLDDFVLSNPSRVGYEFRGWMDGYSERPEFTKVVSAGSIGIKQFTAVWEPVIYSLKVDAAGGRFADGYLIPSTYTIEDSVNLQSPVRTGYQFVDWTIDGTERGNGSIKKGTHGDREYVANWALEHYTISYDLDGGRYEDGRVNPADYTIETEDLSLVNPVLDGYTFAGWTSTEIAVPDRAVKVTKGSVGNLAFKANWIKNEREMYRITSDLNGGRVTEELPEYYYSDEELAVPDPIKTGYDFMGWAVNGSGPAVSLVIAKGTVGDLKLKAQWKIRTYRVKYRMNGGTLTGKSNPKTYTVKDSFTLKNPTRKGYMFNGWVNSSTGDFDLVMKVRKGTVGNVTFTAKWLKSKVPEAYLCADLYKTLNRDSKFRIKIANTKGCDLKWRVGDRSITSVKGTTIKAKSPGVTKMICTVIRKGCVVYKFALKVTVQRSKYRTLNTSYDMKRFRGKTPIVILDKTIPVGGCSKISFENAAGAQVSYKVDDPRIASIDHGGVITGHRRGYTYGMAIVKKGGRTTRYAFHFKVGR